MSMGKSNMLDQLPECECLSSALGALMYLRHQMVFEIIIKIQ